MKICPGCNAANQTDSLFCAGCGNPLPAQMNGKNPLSAPLIILIVVLTLCGICGMCGGISAVLDRNESGRQQSAETADHSSIPVADQPRRLASTPPPPDPSSAEVPEAKEFGKNDAAEKSVEQKSNQTATIIADSAELRRTPSRTGEFAGELAEDAQVQVIRQKGAWFYVRSGNQTGWLHGNMIRLNADIPTNEKDLSNDNFDADAAADSSTDYSQPSRSVGRSSSPAKAAPPKVKSKTVPASGATAKCRDGSLSFSRSRRGTCSHHGGVAVWY